MIKILLLVLAIVLLVPVLLVVSLRVIDPPVTMPMLQRAIERSWAEQTFHWPAMRWLDRDEIPQRFVLYVWTSEDQRFFTHGGFDWIEMRNAVEEAQRLGRPPRGASTITMQTARSVFLWHGRSWIRKGLEAYFTLLMELFLSKQRILELYVNVIETGPDTYGLEAGAQKHYGRPAGELDAHEFAMLAAILPNPKEWDPVNAPPKLIRRRDQILKRAAAASFPEDQFPEPGKK